MSETLRIWMSGICLGIAIGLLLGYAFAHITA